MSTFVPRAVVIAVTSAASCEDTAVMASLIIDTFPSMAVLSYTSATLAFSCSAAATSVPFAFVASRLSMSVSTPFTVISPVASTDT
ncbi:hypothetical protein Barb7_01381 [Bacteroidales bacterium Barb7]|nr:hypothetical protein Barb7_01381 [Bacteroidales bacterium Barb7]